MKKAVLLALALAGATLVCQAQVAPTPPSYGYLLVRQGGATTKVPIIAIYHKGDVGMQRFALIAMSDTKTYDLEFRLPSLGTFQLKSPQSPACAFYSSYDGSNTPGTLPQSFATNETLQKNSSGFVAVNTESGRSSGYFHLTVYAIQPTAQVMIDGAFDTK